MKSCNGKISTNLHNNKIPKEDSQFCFSKNSTIPFFEKVKIIIFKRIDDIEISAGLDGENSDEENFDEANLKILI